MKYTLPQLLMQIDEVIFTNNQQLIKALFENQLLKNIVESTYPEASQATQQEMAWVSTETYSGSNVYRFWNGKLYLFVGTEPDQGTEPGTDATVWQEVPFSSLAHAQNTDFKLGEYKVVVDPTTSAGLVTLTDTAYLGKNLVELLKTDGAGVYDVSLKSRDDQTAFPHIFKVQVPFGAPHSVRFTNDENQYIGTAPLTLAAGQFAVFQRSASPEGNKTRLQYSSQQAAGGAANPFDQELNTTNSVIFQALLLAASTGPADRNRLLMVGPSGNVQAAVAAYFDLFSNLTLPKGITLTDFAAHVGKYLALTTGGAVTVKDKISIEDVIFTEIKIINQATGLPETWQVVGSYFKKVS